MSMRSRRRGQEKLEELSESKIRRVARLVRREALARLKSDIERFFRERWQVKVQISEERALELVWALLYKQSGARAPRFPDIYRQILRQKPWLARKWFSMLKYEEARGRLPIRYWSQLYLTARAQEARLLYLLVHMARGKPWRCLNQAVCQHRRILGTDSVIVESGRFYVDPRDFPRIIRMLADVGSSRELIITYHYRGRPPPDVPAKYYPYPRNPDKRGWWGKIVASPADLVREPDILWALSWADEIIMWSARPWSVGPCRCA